MQPGTCPVPCSWLLGPPWLCDKGTVSRRPQEQHKSKPRSGSWVSGDRNLDSWCIRRNKIEKHGCRRSVAACKHSVRLPGLTPGAQCHLAQKEIMLEYCQK